MTRREMILALMTDGSMDDEIGIMIYDRAPDQRLIGIDHYKVSRVSGMNRETVVAEKATLSKLTKVEANL